MRVLAVSFAVLGFAGVAAAETGGEIGIDLEEETGTAEIVGGTLAAAGKWPDTVAVIGPNGACTGTLIAPDVVLTAGHCIGGMTRVIANTIDYNAAGGSQATIKTQTAYPNWENTFDIGVLVLNTPITGVTPRMVGTECTFSSFMTKPTVQLVGFGATDNAATAPNTKLYEVTVPVIDPVCNTPGAGCKPGAIVGGKPGEFIAGGNNKDSCNGDSGGPVYLTTPRGPVVIGAVSRALDSATTPCGGGGIYVRTDRVVQWLETTSGKTVSKDTCATMPTNPENPGENPQNPDNPGGGTQPGEESQDVVGGCSTSRGTGFGFMLLLGFALFRRRR